MKIADLPNEILEAIYLQLDIPSLKYISNCNHLLNDIITKSFTDIYFKNNQLFYEPIDEFKKQLTHIDKYFIPKAKMHTIGFNITETYLDQQTQTNIRERVGYNTYSISYKNLFSISNNLNNYFKQINVRKGDLVKLECLYVEFFFYDGEKLIKIQFHNFQYLIPKEFSIIESFSPQHWSKEISQYWIYVDMEPYKEHIKNNITEYLYLDKKNFFIRIVSKYGKIFIINIQSEDKNQAIEKIMESIFLINFSPS